MYVAVPAAEWPSAAAVQQCLDAQRYPLKLSRFPRFDPKQVVTDGAFGTVDGKTDAYLEGRVSPALLAKDEVDDINGRIAAAGSAFRISTGAALMSIRTRSPAEMRAASYLVSSLIVCFHGYGFEPQGNEHGGGDFAKSLISSVDALKGL